MSASEGSLGSPGTGSAAPPPAAPSAAPPPAAAPPSAAAPPAADPVAPPPSDGAAASSTPGATAPPDARPKTMDEVRERFHQRLQRIQTGEGANQRGEESPAPQDQPAPQAAEPAAPAPPKTTQPKVQEPPPAVEAPEAAAAEAEEQPPPPVEVAPIAEDVDTDVDTTEDLDTILTLDELETRYPRQMSKKVKAAIAARETERGELRQKINGIGGTHGLQLAETLNPIIWKHDPTDEDVDNLLDYLVLPEHAGAEKLVRKMSERLVNTALQDERTGKAFASQIIGEEWGNRPDGKPYDLETVDLLIKGHQQGLIDEEVLKSELAGAPQPTEREKELERQLAELRSTQEAKAEEDARTLEKRKSVYKTQAKGYVSRYVMQTVLPEASKSGWAASEGDTGEVLEEKKQLGELVADHVNAKLAATPAYAEVEAMIEDQTAFDAAGNPTQRFLVKLDPLQNMALALFRQKQRSLSKRFKYSAQSSHNAKLVAKNGSKKAAAPTSEDTSEPPPPPVQEVPQTERKAFQTTEDAMQQVREKFRTARQAELRNQTVGTLRR